MGNPQPVGFTVTLPAAAPWLAYIYKYILIFLFTYKSKNKNINLNLLFSWVGIEPQPIVQSHTLVPLRHDWLQIFFKYLRFLGNKSIFVSKVLRIAGTIAWHVGRSRKLTTSTYWRDLISMYITRFIHTKHVNLTSLQRLLRSFA